MLNKCSVFNTAIKVHIFDYFIFQIQISSGEDFLFPFLFVCFFCFLFIALEGKMELDSKEEIVGNEFKRRNK